MRIAVIRDKPGDDVDPRTYLEFQVYKSPKSGEVLGGWMHQAIIADSSPGSTTIHQSKEIGKPVADAWQEAIAYSDAHGVEAIWIDDPNNLFQPALQR